MSNAAVLALVVQHAVARPDLCLSPKTVLAMASTCRMTWRAYRMDLGKWALQRWRRRMARALADFNVMCECWFTTRVPTIDPFTCVHQAVWERRHASCAKYHRHESCESCDHPLAPLRGADEGIVCRRDRLVIHEPNYLLFMFPSDEKVVETTCAWGHLHVVRWRTRAQKMTAYSEVCDSGSDYEYDPLP